MFFKTSLSFLSRHRKIFNTFYKGGAEPSLRYGSAPRRIFNIYIGVSTWYKFFKKFGTKRPKIFHNFSTKFFYFPKKFFIFPHGVFKNFYGFATFYKNPKSVGLAALFQDLGYFSLGEALTSNVLPQPVSDFFFLKFLEIDSKCWSKLVKAVSNSNLVRIYRTITPLMSGSITACNRVYQ